MRREEMIKVENYFEFFIITFMIGFFLYLIKDFLISIFLAITFAFIFYKPYYKLFQKTKNETITAIFIIFIILTLILLPTYLLSLTLVKQTSIIIHNTDDMFNNLDLENCSYIFCETIKNNLDTIDLKFETLIKKSGSYIINSFSQIFNSVAAIILNFLIFILAFYYLLIDGKKFLQNIRKIIPMKNDYKDALFYRFKDVTIAVFVGSIFVAIIQGTLVGIGFKIFGFESPLFWGTIASFFSLIPMVGSAIIWFPAVLYLFYQTNYVAAVLFLIYGGIIVALSDDLIRPFLIKQKIKVHSFLILLSIIGGINLFGFIGIFIGPVIISLLITIFQLYNLDFK